MRTKRNKNERSALVEGAQLVPFLPVGRAPSLVVIQTPPADVERVFVASPVSGEYAMSIRGLLQNYRLATAEEATAAERAWQAPPDLMSGRRWLRRKLPKVESATTGAEPSSSSETAPTAVPVDTHQAVPVAAPVPAPELPKPVEPPAYAVNGEGSAIELGGKSLAVHAFRGRPCVVAAELGKLLGYSDEGRDLSDCITKKWTPEMLAGRDFDVLEGDDLRQFKAFLSLRDPGSLSRNARACVVVYERGVDLISTRTDKPWGASLRAYLVDEVLPKLRRGEAVPPAGAPAPQVEAPSQPSAIGGGDDVARRLLDQLEQQGRLAAEHAQSTRALIAILGKQHPKLTSAQAPATVPQAPIKRGKAAPIDADPDPDLFYQVEHFAVLLRARTQKRGITDVTVGKAITELGYRNRDDLQQLGVGTAKNISPPKPVTITLWRGSIFPALLKHFGPQTSMPGT